MTRRANRIVIDIVAITIFTTYIHTILIGSWRERGNNQGSISVVIELRNGGVEEVVVDGCVVSCLLPGGGLAVGVVLSFIVRGELAGVGADGVAVGIYVLKVIHRCAIRVLGAEVEAVHKSVGDLLLVDIVETFVFALDEERFSVDWVGIVVVF